MRDTPVYRTPSGQPQVRSESAKAILNYVSDVTHRKPPRATTLKQWLLYHRKRRDYYSLSFGFGRKILIPQYLRKDR